MSWVIIIVGIVLASPVVSIGLGKFQKYRQQRKRADADVDRVQVYDARSGEEEAERIKMAVLIDDYRRGKKPCDPGSCLICGERFETRADIGDPFLDVFCGFHIEPALKAVGYFNFASPGKVGAQAA